MTYALTEVRYRTIRPPGSVPNVPVTLPGRIAGQDPVAALRRPNGTVPP